MQKSSWIAAARHDLEPNLQLLAAPGYVVLAPNFHGSTSWGQESD